MEKFSRKPIASIVNGFIWLAWAGLLALASFTILLSMSGNGEVFSAIDIPVKMDEMFVRKVQRIDIPKAYMIIAQEGSFKMRIEPGWKNKIWIFLTVTVVFLWISVILYQVQKILRSFVQDEPFDKKNLYRIRIIAFIFIGYFAGKSLFVIAMERYLTSIIRLENIKLGYDNGTTFLWLGLVMLMLEAVFKRGVVLEEEEQLTI